MAWHLGEQCFILGCIFTVDACIFRTPQCHNSMGLQTPRKLKCGKNVPEYDNSCRVSLCYDSGKCLFE